MTKSSHQSQSAGPLHVLSVSLHAKRRTVLRSGANPEDCSSWICFSTLNTLRAQTNFG